MKYKPDIVSQWLILLFVCLFRNSSIKWDDAQCSLVFLFARLSVWVIVSWYLSWCTHVCRAYVPIMMNYDMMCASEMFIRTFPAEPAKRFSSVINWSKAQWKGCSMCALLHFSYSALCLKNEYMLYNINTCLSSDKSGVV